MVMLNPQWTPPPKPEFSMGELAEVDRTMYLGITVFLETMAKQIAQEDLPLEKQVFNTYLLGLDKGMYRVSVDLTQQPPHWELMIWNGTEYTSEEYDGPIDDTC